MPPRQPLKLKTAKKAATPARAKPAGRGVPPVTQPAPVQALPTTAKSPAQPPQTTTKPPAKPSRFAGFGLYPDLTMAIAMLAKRRAQLARSAAADAGGSVELIDKWLVSLNKVQQEMTRLRRLEDLSTALGRPLSSLES